MGAVGFNVLELQGCVIHRFLSMFMDSSHVNVYWTTKYFHFRTILLLD